MDSLLLRDIFCCPFCRGDLVADTAADAKVCSCCGKKFPFVSGILDLNPEPSATVAAEMIAHRQLEETWLETVPESLHPYVTGRAAADLLFALPRLTNPGLSAVPSLNRIAENAEDFFELLEWMQIQEGEVILELGSHIGWAAHHLARRGARVVATDVSHQLTIAEAFVAAGWPIWRTFMDMNRMPVKDGVIDTIFAVATIHHTDDLHGLFASCARVLKPMGRCVFFSEPVVGYLDPSAKAAFGSEEKQMGIQEHAYTIREYFTAARHAGLEPHILPLSGILKEPQRRYKCFRWLWQLLLKVGLGYLPPFTKFLYKYMLYAYPKIPFPRYALILYKREKR